MQKGRSIDILNTFFNINKGESISTSSGSSVSTGVPESPISETGLIGEVEWKSLAAIQADEFPEALAKALEQEENSHGGEPPPALLPKEEEAEKKKQCDR